MSASPPKAEFYIGAWSKLASSAIQRVQQEMKAPTRPREAEGAQVKLKR
jgi:hypothetical protein